MIHFKSTKVLIPVDFSETSMLAIQHGAFTAQLTKSSVCLLHVINAQYVSQNMFIPVVSIEGQGQFEQKVIDKLAEISENIKLEYGIQVEIIIRTGSPNSEIVNVAKEIAASLIVMGTHGYAPLEELVIGSVALKVLTKAPCPTMVMSSVASHKGFNKIALPIDTSPHSRQKVNYAIEFAKQFSARVYAFAILRNDEEAEKPAMEVILSQIQKIAKEHDVICNTEILMHVKNRAEETIVYGEKIGADLNVIMTDQESEFSGYFLGPYAQQIIHLSKIPTIAIKALKLGIDGNATILAGTAGGNN
jgi:nucleotide-binding universal stress UspA family protein